MAAYFFAAGVVVDLLRETFVINQRRCNRLHRAAGSKRLAPVLDEEALVFGGIHFAPVGRQIVYVHLYPRIGGGKSNDPAGGVFQHNDAALGAAYFLISKILYPVDGGKPERAAVMRPVAGHQYVLKPSPQSVTAVDRAVEPDKLAV